MALRDDGDRGEWRSSACKNDGHDRASDLIAETVFISREIEQARKRLTIQEILFDEIVDLPPDRPMMIMDADKRDFLNCAALCSIKDPCPDDQFLSLE